MFDTFALLIIIVLLLLIAIAIIINNMRVSAKIEAIRQIFEDRWRMQMQAQRDQRQATVRKDPVAWLREILPFDLPVGEVSAKAYQRFNTVRVDFAGGTVVVSPRSFKTLRQEVARWKKENGLRAMEEGVPLPDGKPKQIVKIGVDNTLAVLTYFDEDAAAAGKAWGVDWGQPRALYFMLF